MKKNCENCLWKGFEIEEEETFWCHKYDCRCNEVLKEEEPSCWDDIPAEIYDSHTCDYENGCCKICGKIEYKSMLYCELYGCDPEPIKNNKNH